MARILTGVQATGVPHLGNILGAIVPGVQLSQNQDNEALFFIADLHSLTSKKDADFIRESSYAVAAAWLAFGFNTDKNIFYRQSDIPEVTEMTWYLNCFTPYPMLGNAHSFKDKSDRLSDVNAGLFTYPVLMACDILMYDADIVPVGKDQRQHLEMTRDIASAVNHNLNEELLKLPEAKIDNRVMTVPGTDGQKMSKSYGNTINIFQSDKALKKEVMGILTDSTPLEERKDPETCVVYNIYKLLATEEQTKAMADQLRAGGYGYGHAKKDLLNLILDKYKDERERFNHFMENREILDKELEAGAEKARAIGLPILKKLRSKLGYRV